MKTNNTYKKAIFALATVIAGIGITTAQVKEYLNVLPTKATVVMAIDTKSLLHKSELEGRDTVLINLITGAQNIKNPIAKNALLNIVKNPAEMGFDGSEKLYFATVDYIDLVILKIADADKVKSFMKLGIMSNYISSITDYEGYWIANTEEGMVMAFNNETFMMFNTNRIYEDFDTNDFVSALLNNKLENSIAINKDFQQTVANMRDIAAFFTFESLVDNEMQDIYAAMYGNADIDFSKLSMGFNAEFRNGMLAISGTIHSEDPQVLEGFAKMKSYSQIKSKYADYLPSSAMFYAAMNLNGEEIYKILSQNTLVSSLLGDQMKSFEKIKSLNGDVAFVMTNTDSKSGLSLTALAEVKDSDFLKMFTDKKNGILSRDKIKLFSKNKYVIEDYSSKSYIGMDGKTFFFTNDFEFASKKIAKNPNPISSNPKIANSKDAYSYVMINFEEVFKSNLVKSFYNEDDAEATALFNSLNEFSFMELLAKTTTTLEINLYLKNSNENSLKMILNLFKLLREFDNDDEFIPEIEEPVEMEIVEDSRAA